MIATSEIALPETYRGLRVLVTGHTGFKGAWLCLWLQELGAVVAGLSDIVPTEPSAFDFFGAGAMAQDYRADIRDIAAVLQAVQDWQPELILHLAAQPIVRRAVRDPMEAFTVNIIGTAAVLEAARQVACVRAVLVVTSDKVYANDNSGRAFVETDPVGGHEPYGASKAAAEIVAATYRSAGFHRGAGSVNHPVVATARAGNVIGGGDWAADRLIPDAVRAIMEGTTITSDLAKQRLGWAPGWSWDQAVARVAEWHRGHLTPGTDLAALARRQIADYRAASPVAAFRYDLTVRRVA